MAEASTAFGEVAGEALEAGHAFMEDRKPRHNGKRVGWQATVFMWTWVVVSVLITNLIILIWTSIRRAPSELATAKGSSPRDSEIILYEGSCDRASTIRLWVHLGINILSSLLLAASASCMQCLSSPTRQNLNDAHRDGKHLDIGKLSLRNFRYISAQRIVLWVILAISSAPLHLFYNSIVFTTLAARDVASFVATRDSVTMQTFNQSAFEKLTASGMQRDVYNWAEPAALLESVNDLLSARPSPAAVKLDSDECMATFNQSIVSTYRSVALIVNATSAEQILDLAISEGMGVKQPWTCYLTGCGFQNLVSSPRNIPAQNTIELLECCYLNYGMGQYLYRGYPSSTDTAVSDDAFIDTHTIQAYALTRNAYNFSVADRQLWSEGPEILECIAETAEGKCTVELAQSLLIVVIVANLAKAVAMVWTMRFVKFEPLITIGDAIRTSLNQPSYIGQPLPPEEAKPSSALLEGQSKPATTRLWSQPTRFWAGSATWKTWTAAIGLCVVLEIIAGFLLAMSIQHLDDGGLQQSQTDGFGAVTPNSFAVLSSTSLATLSMVSNVPQLLVSIVYIAYYSLLSTMVINAETAEFVKRPKSLRVSPPRYGAQRGTYFLNLPQRYAIPLMLAMILLHYLISESLFVVRVNRVLYNNTIKYNVLNGVGWSSIAIVASMAWGGVIILLPILLGFRTLPRGAPNIGLNSLKIAAACQPDPREKRNVAELELMYGDLPGRDEQGEQRVGFGSAELLKPGYKPPSLREQSLGLAIRWPWKMARPTATEENEMAELSENQQPFVSPAPSKHVRTDSELRVHEVSGTRTW